jgi:hypothetical protein
MRIWDLQFRFGTNMKPIKKNELFGHLSEFLKSRGIEFKEGAYAQGIQKGCSILTDTINLSQQGLEITKTQIEKQLDGMRQVIHEHTAPKPAPGGKSAQRGKSAPKESAKKAPKKAKAGK